MIDDVDRTAAFSFAKRRFNGFNQPRTIVFSNHETIQNDMKRWRLVEPHLS